MSDMGSQSHEMRESFPLPLAGVVEEILSWNLSCLVHPALRISKQHKIPKILVELAFQCHLIFYFFFFFFKLSTKNVWPLPKKNFTWKMGLRSDFLSNRFNSCISLTHVKQTLWHMHFLEQTKSQTFCSL